MKNALLKDFGREIRKNKGRFLSIFFIVLLGAALFSGIRSTGTDMKYSADVFYDETNMMDIRVLSTLGLTEDDINDMADVKGVKSATGGYTQDVIIDTATDEYAIKVIAETNDVNQLTLFEGREISDSNECVVDREFLETSGYKIGDKITLLSGNEYYLSDTLKQTKFTIVGSVSLPYYLDLTRGTCNIGDGKLSGYIIIQPEVFSLDYYTEAYITVSGAAELNSYSDEYTDLCTPVVDRLEKLADTATVRRYNELKDDAQKKIDDGQAEITDAENKLNDAKKQLDDGKATLDESKQKLDEAALEITENTQTLNDAKAQLDSGEEQLSSAKAELSANEEKIISGQAELDSRQSQLDSASQQLSDAQSQLDTASAQIAEKETELTNGYAALEAANTQLEENRSTLESLQLQQAQVAEAYDQVLAMLELDPENEELKAQAAQLQATLDTLNTSIAQLTDGISAAETQLEATKAQLDEGTAALNAAKQQLQEQSASVEAARSELESGKSALETAKNQLNAASSQLEAGRQTIASSEAELNSSIAQYNDGFAQLESGKQEYADGLAEYEDGLTEWNDSKAEYDSSYDEAMQKINDAKAELQDAKDSLSQLEVPTWYVLDRDKISSCVSFGTDGERMDNLGNVFPVLFFLVAALVSLTAMTRMVEEQRQQIGTLKALGYGNSKIAAKFVCYALLATLTGSIAGVIIGEKSLPFVVMWAYTGTLYTGLTHFFVPLNLVQGLLAVCISIACTGIASYLACRMMLRECPASLMRPEAPKNGRKIFLEHIPFIWKRLSFTYKATCRNLFRYKKRFVMTIIGIGGCMGLMLVGFGIKDSITVVAKNQYIEIFKQDASVTIDTSADEGDIASLNKTIDNYDGITDRLDVVQQTVTLNANDTNREAILYVPQTLDDISDFVRFRDRVTKENYDFPENGCVLSEKTATMLGVSVGDTITIQKSETDPKYEETVSLIVENYVQHYIFMSSDEYQKIFDESPDYNYVYIKYNDNSDDYQKTLGKTLLANDACTGVSYTTSLEDTITDMLQALDVIIWVLIITAAMLAFVVLYNLNSISMMERKRELATLKVLGFYDTEVAMYVYRENIILTLIGIVAGLFIGKLLHQFTILTVEVDLMMFGRNITISSYIICSVIAFCFSLIINLIMYRHFKHIDMIESLKSVE